MCQEEENLTFEFVVQMKLKAVIFIMLRGHIIIQLMNLESPAVSQNHQIEKRRSALFAVSQQLQ